MTDHEEFSRWVYVNTQSDTCLAFHMQIWRYFVSCAVDVYDRDSR